ncbi:hypothetical protein AAE478_005361 [Parahypoxylon ruwenzoriense]
MPARFPDTTFVTNPDIIEPQPRTNGGSICRLMVKKAGGREVWGLGSEHVLKTRGYYPGGEVEVQNTKFAAEKTGCPVGDIIASWREEENENRVFIVQERIEGESLESALVKLTEEDRKNIGSQLGEYLLRLRAITSPQMQMLNGGRVIDRRLLKPLSYPETAGYTVCSSDAEVAANLSLAIAFKLDAETLKAFMARMPSATPFTFSHSDVHEGNIMVKDGNFAGLVDWELGGYYPRWWEFVNSCQLLSDHLPTELQETKALDWFRVYHAVRERPGEESTRMAREYVRRT